MKHKVKELKFQVTEKLGDLLYAAKTEHGRFTVLDRTTVLGYRQTESGFLDEEKFYLMQGDIREGDLTIAEAIEKFKTKGYSTKAK